MKKKDKEKKSIKTNCDKDPPRNLSFEAIEKASEGLYYVSETDAEILPFIGRKADRVSKEEVLNQTESAENSAIEERNFDEFFKRLTEIQDWFGEEETIQAKRFSELKKLLESNLRDLKIFKIGAVELNIYIVGLDEEDILKGLQTKAVET